MSNAIKEGIRSFGRDRIQSLIAIGVTTASLFVLGIFLLVTVNLQRIVKVTQEKVEISAFLKDNLIQKDVENLQRTIQGITGVKEVLYLSKEDALLLLKKDLAEERDLLEALETNPLPASFKIILHASHKGSKEVGDLSRRIEGLKGIEEVNFGGEWVEQLDRWVRIIWMLDLIIGVLIGGASLFVIFNTILFTVFSKREEIEIMSLVGATEGFIRRPFLTAGSLYGILGGCLASLLIMGLTQLGRTRFPDLVSLEWKFLLGIVGFGFLIGYWGSYLSLRRIVKIWEK